MPKVALATEPIIHTKAWWRATHARSITAVLAKLALALMLLRGHRTLLLRQLRRAHHSRVGALRIRGPHEIHQEFSVTVIPCWVRWIALVPARALTRNSLMVTEEILHKLIWTSSLLVRPRRVDFLRMLRWRTTCRAILSLTLHLLEWRRACLLWSFRLVRRRCCKGCCSRRRGAHALPLKLSNDVLESLFLIRGS